MSYQPLTPVQRKGDPTISLDYLSSLRYQGTARPPVKNTDLSTLTGFVPERNLWLRSPFLVHTQDHG